MATLKNRIHLNRVPYGIFILKSDFSLLLTPQGIKAISVCYSVPEWLVEKTIKDYGILFGASMINPL